MPGTLQDFAQAVHDVISINRDAEQGFRGAANAVHDPTMKDLFQQYAAQRAQFAVELHTAVKSLGFDSPDPQGLGGILHASWMSLKALATGHDVHPILAETERAEDWSIRTYRTALATAMPPELGSIIQRQFEEVRAAHDRIRALRDSTAPPDGEPTVSDRSMPQRHEESIPAKDSSAAENPRGSDYRS